MTGARETPMDVVRRWETSGGHWRVLSRSQESIVLGLFSCDGGTEMHRFTAASAELDPLLEDRTRSDD